MARPVKGDTRVQRYRRTLKNGVIYVYEREVRYNPETRRNDTLSNRLIGKILPDTGGRMIDTKFRAPPFECAEKRNDKDQKDLRESSAEGKPNDRDYRGITRSHLGMMLILDWAGRISGIDEDIRGSFPSDETGELADRIIQFARFLVATDGGGHTNLEAWQIHHGIPSEEQLSDDICLHLFESLPKNEKHIQNFFKRRAQRLNVKDAIVFEASPILVYSEKQIQTCSDCRKDNDSLQAIKLYIIYSLDTVQPCAYTIQSGNLPEIICLKDALKQLAFLGTEKPMFVLNNGSYSVDNTAALVYEDMKFMVRVAPSDASWIRKAVDENLEKLWGPNTDLIAGDRDVAGYSCTVRPELTYTCKRNLVNHKAGDIVKLNPCLHLMIYQGQSLKSECEQYLISEINSLKAHIENGGETELDAYSLVRAHNYLSWEKVKDNKFKVQLKTETYDEAVKYAGVSLLLSDQEIDKDDGLLLYSKREHIEDMFALFKENADGKKTRVWTSERMRGRTFIQFVALCYYEFLYSKIKSVKQMLIEPEDPNMGKIHNQIRKELKDWLAEASQSDILQWFDAVEITRLMGRKSPSIKTVTETMARDKMFLALLGYSG